MTQTSQDPYETLRHGLIWGRWKSGERLVPQRLKQELGCTSSVLREAMLRLAGEGLILSEKNHGFRAMSHSQETFLEAAQLRFVLEREAVALSLRHGDFDWEMDLSAAHQKLAYVEQQMEAADDATAYLRHWSLQDWEFHSTLMRACGSDLLMRAYKSAFDTFRMYAVARFSNYGFGQKVTAQEHLDIYTAAIARDIPECIAAIERHLKIDKSGAQVTNLFALKT